MRRMKVLAALSVVTLLAATTAWAGGASCSGKSSEASASKSCPVSGAKMTSAGGAGGNHCEGMKSNAMAKGCEVGANQAIYSFAVPGAECNGCAHSIQSALKRTAGVHCAHVDLDNHIAYVIADKKMDKNALSKVIQTAGFKNTFRGDGAKVKAEFAKAMAGASETSGLSCCSRAKDKV